MSRKTYVLPLGVLRPMSGRGFTLDDHTDTVQFTRYLPLQLIKTSFAVTNSYVLQKLRLILFPWRHKTWTRQIRRSTENGSMEGWQPPRDDINAPDLYIPSTSYTTVTRFRRPHESHEGGTILMSCSDGTGNLYPSLGIILRPPIQIPPRSPRLLVE